jgi:HNH endonuclease
MAAESARCQKCRPQPLAERFERYVERTDSCWLWTGHRDRKGYGRFLLHKGSSDRAHRVAYELAVGPIPEGHELHHTCGEPGCVNPGHLETITPSEHARLHRLRERSAA